MTTDTEQMSSESHDLKDYFSTAIQWYVVCKQNKTPVNEAGVNWSATTKYLQAKSMFINSTLIS